MSHPILLLTPYFWETRSNELIDRYTVYKDHVSLRDYEINDGMSLEMY